MAVPAAESRPRLPRRAAQGVVAFIVLLTAAAFAWPSLPFNRSAASVVGPTRVGVITGQIEAPGAPAVGYAAPEFQWVGADGRTVRLSSLRGGPVVLNFWATWCVPCKTEMPLLDSTAKAEPGTRFLAIDMGEDGATVRGFLDQAGITTLEPLLDIGLQTAQHYSVMSLPTTFFVDASGIVRFVRIGPLDQELLRKGLDEIR